MDRSEFEELSRRIGTAAGRRDAFRLAAAGIAASLGMRSLVAKAETGAEGVPIYHCKIPGQTCKRDTNCCSGKCNKGVCSCNKKGKKCFEPLRGAICCSGRCKNGKCK